jgi:hypothetical protein
MENVDYAVTGCLSISTPYVVDGWISGPPVQLFEFYEGGTLDLSKCLNNEMRLEWFGGLPNRPDIDCSIALERLQKAVCPTSTHRDGLDVHGVKVALCHGTYYFHTQPKIFRPLWIVGAVGSIYNISTRWQIADGVPGPVILSHRQIEGGGGGHGTKIENVAIAAGGKSNPEAHGLTTNCVVEVRNCWITGFGGDGIYIDGDTATVSGKNCSLTVFERVRSENNAGNGFFAKGGDANLIEFSRCESSYNGKWGYCDRGFLGNLYLAPHASFNGRSNTTNSKRYGAYCIGLGENDDFTGARPNRTTLINPYSEGADPIEGESRFSGNTMIINPNLSAGHSVYMGGQVIGPQYTRFSVQTPPVMRPGFAPFMFYKRLGQTEPFIIVHDEKGQPIWKLNADGTTGI